LPYRHYRRRRSAPVGGRAGPQVLSAEGGTPQVPARNWTRANDKPILLRTLRRSTPVLASPHVLLGFFRCCLTRGTFVPVTWPGSHPRRYCCASLADSPSQALKNATSSAFFTHAISAPLAQLRVRGASGRKNPTANAGAVEAPLPKIVSAGACAAPRSPEVFRVCPERSAAERRDAEMAGQ
jgi:hypothetical protein